MYFTCRCNEPEGPKFRLVMDLVPLPERVLGVIEKVRGLTSLFGNDDVMSAIFDPAARFYLVDDVGILAAIPGDGGIHVHITFWDKRLRGREELCRRAAIEAAGEFGAGKVWTAIPEERRVALAFAKRVGFVERARVGSTVLLDLPL